MEYYRSKASALGLTDKVHAFVEECHRSREFIEFLKLLDAAYPASTSIKIILANHSAHTSQTKAWLATQPEGRFEFTFPPKHCAWLNLIECCSKLAPAALRHIRVVSKQELAERILAAIDDINQQPVGFAAVFRNHFWADKAKLKDIAAPATPQAPKQ